MSKLHDPGEKPTSPGEYLEVGPQGGVVIKPRQVTMEAGDNPLPPTQVPNRKWKRISKPKP